MRSEAQTKEAYPEFKHDYLEVKAVHDVQGRHEQAKDNGVGLIVSVLEQLSDLGVVLEDHLSPFQVRFLTFDVSVLLF